MTQRFVDKKGVFVDEIKFFRRKYGIAYGYLAALFVLVWCVLTLLLYSINGVSFQYYALMSLVVFTAGVLVYFFVLNDRETMHLLDLQNLLFAAGMRQNVQFCMILRYDSEIVYADPDYQSQYRNLAEQGIEGVEALYANHNIDKNSRDRLLKAMQQGEGMQLKFYPNGIEHERNYYVLELNPIRITKSQNSVKGFSLASNSVEIPSGYYLLTVVNHMAKYSHILDRLQMGCCFLEDGLHVSYMNDSCRDMFEYSAQDLAKGVSLDAIISEGRERQKIQEAESDWQGLIHISGNRSCSLPCQVRVVNDFELESGKVAKTLFFSEVAANTHIAAHKTPLQDVARHTDVIDIVRKVSLPAFVCEINGNLVATNDVFLKFASLEEAHAPSSVFDIFPEQSHQALRSVIKQMQSDGMKGAIAPVNIAFSSDVHALLYSNDVVLDDGDGNDIHGIMCYLVDNTELKQLEERFAHSQKMQAVGQLAGGIAHDFNNLLTAMIGFCDLLLMRHPPGNQSFADIMQIKQNANRAANLVRQLLAFSRKQTLQPVVLDLTNIFADLNNLIGRLIGENIELKMSHGKNLGKVKADQVQLEQVVINLAVNARDAMSQGGTLTIATSNIEIKDRASISKDMIKPSDDEFIEKGHYVLIEVTDTGCGIDEELITKIYEPFFSTKEVGAGTGLGLSTVYGIVKQTGGYIYVKSKPNKGTTFSIFFKRCDEMTKEEEESEQSSDLEGSDLTGRGAILLVEDEAAVRMFSKSALTNKGYTVMEADCAQTALALTKQYGKELDLIISDVVMPGMSGPDMMQEIHAEYPQTKVIFISGYGEDAFLDTYGKDRAFNFLAKPYTLQQLALKVKAVLEEKRNKNQ